MMYMPVLLIEVHIVLLFCNKLLIIFLTIDKSICRKYSYISSHVMTVLLTCLKISK